ncbi:MAG TPA: CRISPR-associated RAMP protein Csx10 [Alphaproteobacteria bacterium]|nr:CRISPR-associated RAMP protein Csx10 [Alphaproteobacteria bacterium]
MRRLRIVIKTLSPLYAGALKPYGAFLETGGEISGALLRGAVAAKTLPDCAAPEFKHNHEACGVKELCPFYYLTTGVAFPTCVVAEAERPTEPPLRTMVTCKTAPGFAAQQKANDPRHGVFDTLLHHLAFNAAREASEGGLPPRKCEVCRAPLEPFTRRYVRGPRRHYRQAPVLRTQRMTHVGINRRRESAERRLLFSVQSIVGMVVDGRVLPNAVFSGLMTLPDSWDDRLVEQLKHVLTSINRLGGEQTYGLGRVEVTVHEAEEGEPLETRVQAFNDKLKEVWDTYAGDAPVIEGGYFSIDLLTPALLGTPDGTPTVQLTAEMLKQRARDLGFGGVPDVEAVEYPDDVGTRRPLMFAAPAVVSGWSEAWGLPKPTSLAAVPGSVYVFRTRDLSAWLEALAAIEAQGIGARREEGFGAIRVCDPFHEEVKPI